MLFSDIQIVYILLFGSTLLLIEGMYFLLRDMRNGGGAYTNRRLRLIGAGKDRDAVMGSLRRSELHGASAAIVRVLPQLERLLRESGTVLSPVRFAAICAGLAAGVASVLLLAVPMPRPMIALWSIGAGAALPTLFLMHRRRARLAGFGNQLPEALEMMARSLRAGHPIGAAITMVAREMPDPIGSEFGIVVDETTYGLDLNAALRNMAARVPHPDLGFFIVAIQIQSQTGGNLGEVLGNLAAVIRDRFTLKAKVKVITAQGRSSAFVIGCMPFATSILINFLSPDYFRGVSSDPMFMPGMLLAGGLWAVGILVIYKLVNVRV